MTQLKIIVRGAIFFALLFSTTAFPTSQATSPKPADLGLTVMTVKVNSITAHFDDWWGPYWRMDYSFSSPDLPGNGGNFGHENDCTNCWVGGYTFRSDRSAVVHLYLYDDQNCCFGGLQPVAFNGASNHIWFDVTGANRASTVQCITFYSMSCSLTLTLTGNSSGKNATVSITIDVKTALEYQAFMRRSVLQQYYDMGSILQSGQISRDCYNNYLAGQSRLNEQLVPLILIPFTFFIPATTAEEMVLHWLAHYATEYAVETWIGKSKAEGDAYQLYSVGMFSGGYIACGNLQITWQWYSGYDYSYGGYNNQLLLSELNQLIALINSEEANLAANNIGLNRADQNGVIFDLDRQKAQIQRTLQRLSTMKAYLQGIADGTYGSTCYYVDPPNCRTYAQYLVNNFLTPLQTLLNKDAAYTNATYDLIYNTANTLRTSGNLPCSEVGSSYTATISGIGGMPPRTYWISLSSGSLTPGLTFTAGPSARISGTPTAAGYYSFTLKVTDGAGDTQYVGYGFSTNNRIDIAATTFPAATQYSYYSKSLSSVYGCPPTTWSLYSGALPSGLYLSTGGVVSGTPQTSGTYTFTVKVTDGTSATATRTFSLQVNPGSPPPPPPPCYYAEPQDGVDRCIESAY